MVDDAVYEWRESMVQRHDDIRATPSEGPGQAIWETPSSGSNKISFSANESCVKIDVRN